MRICILVLLLCSFCGSVSIAEVIDLTPDLGHVKKSGKVAEVLYEARDVYRSLSLSSETAWSKYGVKVRKDSVQVYVTLMSEVTGDDLNELGQHFGRVETHFERMVQMQVPFAMLDSFEGNERIAAVDIPSYLTQQEVISEGLDLLGIPAYHERDFKGQNIRVAIIDGGFQDYSLYLGSELPDAVDTISFNTVIENGSTHGTFCAQIIHDIAPDAELCLIAISTSLDFMDAIDWVAVNGFHVVSSSLAFTSSGWPDGSSDLAVSVNTLASHDILYVNAAGNYGKDHWMGTFQDTDSDGWHNFTSTDEGNLVTVYGGTSVTFVLIWDDWPYSSNDFDLYVINYEGTEVVASSERVQSGFQTPCEIIQMDIPVSDVFNIGIKKQSADRQPKFHLYSYYVKHMEYVSALGSVAIPSDAENAFSVGASYFFSPYSIAPFSSCGPTDDGRIKPDIIAPSYVSVNDHDEEVYFSGTSASAPHVAGSAALFLSYRMRVSAFAVADSLRSHRIDLGATGPDNIYGWGFLYFAEDVIPPEFQINLMPNPVLATELNIYAFPDEGLSSDASLMLSTQSDTIFDDMFRLPDRNAETYFWETELSEDGLYTVNICGDDYFLNRGCSIKQFSAVSLSTEAKTFCKSPTGLFDLELCGKGRLNRAIIEDQISQNTLNDQTEDSTIAILNIKSAGQVTGYVTVDLESIRSEISEYPNVVLCRNYSGNADSLIGMASGSDKSLVSVLPGPGEYRLCYSTTPGLQQSSIMLPDTRLSQNYPNPFNATTAIEIYMPAEDHASLKIYNILGQRVRTLVDSRLQSGTTKLVWDGRNDSDEECSSGIYVYRLVTQSTVETKRMVLLK